MQITLTPEMSKWIDEKVRSGFYQSTSEVVREGLRALKEREEQRRLMAQDLRQELIVGLKQLDAKKSRPFNMALVKEIKEIGRTKLGV